MKIKGKDLKLIIAGKEVEPSPDSLRFGIPEDRVNLVVELPKQLLDHLINRDEIKLKTTDNHSITLKRSD